MKLAAVTAAVVILAIARPAAADPRQLVELPGPMQQHMMANMREHLKALEDILGALAAGDVTSAGDIAESRIGMSSLDAHGAAHMAPFMPQPMRAMGTAMHQAASRLGVVAADAEVEHSYDAQRKVFAALRELTAACNTCHASYRIR